MNTGRVEVQPVLRLSKNFTTSQVFKFLRITDTTQTEYSAVVEHPDRFELNSATAMVEHPDLRTIIWTKTYF